MKTALWFVVIALGACEMSYAGPLTPVEAVKSFQLADKDLVIELVAAEPDAVSPVAVAWDEDGRMYVAEMSDYPLGATGGRIRRLENLDSLGRYRKAVVFADGLPFPNGALPWKGGVLVTAAPNIWHLQDSKGTGQADERRILVTGFAEGNQQLRVNGLYWGIDNWVYAANGRSGGKVRGANDLEANGIELGRRDVRFRPDTGQLEAVSGYSQFGLAHDDWGNRFPSWNTTPFRHVVLEERVLSRNPYLAAAGGVADIADAADPGRVFGVSPPPPTFNREPVNFFNASCGNCIYRGDALPADYRGNIFVCEPLTNLVQRRVLVPHGNTFVARRVEAGREFLASTDPWFHAVNLTTGPDGALYVVDFYRRWVEHPGYVPEKLRKEYDWREGSKHGRIWRIRPRTWQAPAPLRLSQATTAELIQHLNGANGWLRDTAQRLLVERQDRQGVLQLEKLATSAPLPQARIHALWTLDGLKSLDDRLLLRILSDGPDDVGRHALQLVERRLAGSPDLKKAVLELTRKPSVTVALAAAVALGGLDDADAVDALVRIAANNLSDEWVRLAVLSGLEKTAWPFLQKALGRHPDWLDIPDPARTLLNNVAALIGTRHDEDTVRQFLQTVVATPENTARYGRLVLLSGFAEGMARSGKSLQSQLAMPPSSWRQSIDGLRSLLKSATELALAENAPIEQRVLSIELLAQAQPNVVARHLPDLLKAAQPQPIQAAAARALAKVDDRDLVRQVLDSWATYSIGCRRELLSALLRSPGLTAILLDALEKEKLAVSELDPSTRQGLQRLPNTMDRQRVQALLKKEPTADRQAIVQRYRAALALAGVPDRGAAVFAKHCSSCHQLQGQGHHVGADLSGIAGRPRETLLTDIFDPSKEVAPDFLNYALVTLNGQVLTGLVVAETATSVKLRRAEGVEEIVLRREIQELRSTGKSLMPEGLEQVLGVQDVADLLEFLQRKKPSQSPTRE